MPTPNQSGLIKEAILIIIALIFIKYYFHIDPLTLWNSTPVQAVIQGAKSLFVDLYNLLDKVAQYLIHR